MNLLNFYIGLQHIHLNMVYVGPIYAIIISVPTPTLYDEACSDKRGKTSRKFSEPSGLGLLWMNDWLRFNVVRSLSVISEHNNSSIADLPPWSFIILWRISQNLKLYYISDYSVITKGIARKEERLSSGFFCIVIIYRL